MTFNESQWKHEWYLAHKDEISARQKRRRAKMTETYSNSPKPVRVEYPESTIPDYYTLTEYKRRQNEFDADARIFINGKPVDTQLELL